MAKVKAIRFSDPGGPDVLHLEEVALEGLLQTCVRMLGPQAERGGVALSVDAGSEAPDAIVADELKLRQILVNLLAHAVKFTGRGGAVTLSAASAHL